MDGNSIVVDAMWLQYGALGLLAMVLAAIFMYMKKSQKFMEDTQRFIQNLAQQSVSNREEEIKAWKQLTRDSIETNTQIIEGLKELSRQIADSREQTETEHQKLLDAITKICEDDK